MLLLPLLCGGIMMHIRELAHVLPGVKLTFRFFFRILERFRKHALYVRGNNDFSCQEE